MRRRKKFTSHKIVLDKERSREDKKREENRKIKVNFIDIFFFFFFYHIQKVNYIN